MPAFFPRFRYKRGTLRAKEFTTSIAGNLPPEILFSIFEQLRRAPPSWTEIMMLVLLEPVPAHVLDSRDDLRAVCLVCKRWCQCAAVLLYASADLYTTKALRRYQRSVQRNPSLLAMATSVRMPDDSQDAVPVFSTIMRRLRRQPAPKPTLNPDMANILRRTTNATGFTLSGNEISTALALCVDRVQQLELRARTQTILEMFERPTIVQLGSDFSGASRITHLVFHGLVITASPELVFPALQHLCIRLSRASGGWLRNLLAHAPAIRSIWLECCFIGIYNALDGVMWHSRELESASPTLRELRTDWSMRQFEPVAGLTFLENLTFLEIPITCLSRMRRDAASPWPPALRQLGLSFRRLTKVDRRAILEGVGQVWRRIHGWKEDQIPQLDSLLLSGDTMRHEDIGNWALASVMLQDRCAGVGVKLTVEIFVLRHRNPARRRR